MGDFLQIGGGLILLFFGGEGLLQGSISLAHSFGLSRLLVSLVIIGFGTSMPEMTVSVTAALQGASEIAVGNVVGSNIANVLLIVGLAVIINPIHIVDKSVRRDIVMMMAASVLLCIVALFGTFNFISGALMLFALCGYIFWCVRQDRQKSLEMASIAEQDIQGKKPLSVPLALLFSFVGLGFLVLGASFLIQGAVALARDFGISEAVIGLTIVAVGTSLPEVATAVVAARRSHGDIVIGNIIGSNIFNVLAILGVTSLIKSITVTGQILVVDIWIMLAVSAILSWFLWFAHPMGRLLGFIMVITYGIYTVALYTGV